MGALHAPPEGAGAEADGPRAVPLWKPRACGCSLPGSQVQREMGRPGRLGTLGREHDFTQVVIFVSGGD